MSKELPKKSPVPGNHSIITIAAHSAPVYALATGDSDGWLFTGGADRVVARWNVSTGIQDSFVVKTDATVFSLLYNPTTQLLFIGCSDGKLHLVNVQKREEVRAWMLDTAGIFDLKMDVERNRLLAAGGNGILTVLDLTSNEVIRSIPLSSGKLRRLALHEQLGLLAVADNTGPVHVLESEHYATVATLNAHAEGSTAVAWHPEKPVLISGGKDAMLRCWNRLDGYNQVLFLAAHQSTIYDVVYHPASKCFVSCSRDKTIKFWNPDTFDPVHKVDYSSGGHKHSVNRLLSQGSFVISASDDRHVILFGV